MVDLGYRDEANQCRELCANGTSKGNDEWNINDTKVFQKLGNVSIGEVETSVSKSNAVSYKRTAGGALGCGGSIWNADGNDVGQMGGCQESSLNEGWAIEPNDEEQYEDTCNSSMTYRRSKPRLCNQVMKAVWSQGKSLLDTITRQDIC